MQIIINLVTMGRAARNQKQIKVRQTLNVLYMPERHKELIYRMSDLIIEEINVKELAFLADKNDVIEYILKPNFKTLGPKFGKNLKMISDAIANSEAYDILTQLQSQKSAQLCFEGETFVLTSEDIMVSLATKENFAFELDHGLFVALDTKLTPELINEGYARELVNKIQFTRKESNFNIMDRIVLFYHSDAEIAQVFEEYKDYICQETLTTQIYREDELKHNMKPWDINGKTVHLAINVKQ